MAADKFVWIDGFESYESTNGNAPVGDITETYNGPDTVDGTRTIEAGRLGQGKSLDMASGNTLQTNDIMNTDEVSCGFAIKFSSVTGGLTQPIFGMFESGGGFNNSLNLVRPSTGSAWQVRRGTAAVLGSSSFSPVVDVWYYVTMRATINASTGIVEVYVATLQGELGDKIIDLTNVNTGSNNRRHVGWDTGNGLAFALDDVYVYDGNFKQHSQVQTLLPNAAGDSAQFTPDSGSNHERVDEVPNDGDTSYVESNTTGHKDLYNFDNIILPQNVTAIDAVQLNALARQTSASIDIKHVTKSGTSEADSAADTIASGTFIHSYHIQETDPDGGGAWSENKLDGAQFGFKVG